MTLVDLWTVLFVGGSVSTVFFVALNVRRWLNPDGVHRAAPAAVADPDLVRLAELIETGEAEAAGKDYCPSPTCGTRTLHLFHNNGTATCQVCQTTTTDGD